MVPKDGLPIYHPTHTTTEVAKSRRRAKGNSTSIAYPMGNLYVAMAITGVSEETLKKWRREGYQGLREGWHYKRMSKNSIVWNIRLLESWVHHGGDSKRHQQDIEAYLRWKDRQPGSSISSTTSA